MNSHPEIAFNIRVFIQTRLPLNPPIGYGGIGAVLASACLDQGLVTRLFRISFNTIRFTLAPFIL